MRAAGGYETKVITPEWFAKGGTAVEFGRPVAMGTATHAAPAPGRVDGPAWLAPRAPRFRPYGELAALPAGTTEEDLEATGLVLVQELDGLSLPYTAWEGERALANEALVAAAAELALPPISLRWYGVLDNGLDFSTLPLLPGGRRWWDEADTQGFIQHSRRRELWLRLPCGDPVGAVAHEVRHLHQLATWGYHARCGEPACKVDAEADAAAFAADFSADFAAAWRWS